MSCICSAASQGPGEPGGAESTNGGSCQGERSRLSQGLLKRRKGYLGCQAEPERDAWLYLSGGPCHNLLHGQKGVVTPL